jgi:DHA2 family multidrug resistance protein
VNASVTAPKSGVLLGVSTVLATLLYSIDSTIVSVALPHIQGSLQATQDQAAWIATAYIVMAAIATPLAGWLGSRYGLRRVMLVSIVGFTFFSILCGVATSMPQMVTFRALQGAFGAALIPLSQVTLMQEFPRDRYAKVMAIWATASMVGPVIGPTLGGWLTDTLSWRWAFYINLPIGVLAWFGFTIAMPKRKPEDARPFDVMGFILLSAALALLQLMLDRGQSNDWFSSTEILAETFFAAVFLYMFVAHALTSRHPFVEPALFRDRNFVICLLTQATMGAFVMSPSVLLPSFLQQLQGYTPTQAGVLMAARGAASILAMFAVGRLMTRLDPRISMIAGAALVAGTLWWMAYFSLYTPAEYFIISGLLLGFGMPLTFIPTQIIAFATLPERHRNEAGVLLRLGVSLGGSAGISLAVAQLARSTQVNNAYLSEHFTPYTTDLWRLAGVVPGANGDTGLLIGEINRQALSIAYNNVFFLLAFTALLCVPLILLLRRTRTAAI